jgi:hypothetical protein
VPNVGRKIASIAGVENIDTVNIAEAIHSWTWDRRM